MFCIILSSWEGILVLKESSLGLWNFFYKIYPEVLDNLKPLQWFLGPFMLAPLYGLFSTGFDLDSFWNDFCILSALAYLLLPKLVVAGTDLNENIESFVDSILLPNMTTRIWGCLRSHCSQLHERNWFLSQISHLNLMICGSFLIWSLDKVYSFTYLILFLIYFVTCWGESFSAPGLCCHFSLKSFLIEFYLYIISNTCL